MMSAHHPDSVPACLKTALREAYRALAPYSNHALFEFGFNLQNLMSIARYVPKDGLVLDVGCYIGVVPIALKLLGYDVVGIDKYLFRSDVSSSFYFGQDEREKLEAVWRKYHIEILPKDILTDDLGGAYDAIVTHDVIEHQRLPKLFLHRISMHLKPGGILQLSTPNVVNLLNRLRILLGRAPMGNIEEWYSESENFTGHIREYTLAELVAMFEWSGFGILDARTVQAQSIRIRRWKHLPRAAARLVARTCFWSSSTVGDLNIVAARKPMV
ncbi:MAG: class I SAM-dependent methyltransferase [Patescibacteria group bacterium]